jgi:calcyphosin
LKARGAKTIRGLGRRFKIMDSYDGNRRLDRQEFYYGLKEMDVQITKDESNVSFPFFSP